MFKDLIGETLQFYGAVNNQFKIYHEQYGYIIFEAIEDENDGYRSCLEDIKVVNDSNEIFFKSSIANVRIEPVDTVMVGYNLVDVDTGHVWLEFGTDEYDIYYPMFVFNYTPDKSQTIKATMPNTSIDRFTLGVNSLVEKLVEKGIDTNIICEALIDVAEVFHEQPEEGSLLNIVVNYSN